MAQLIKLQDYISRYETSIYQYPSQFLRLKRENWRKSKHLFEQGLLEEDVEELEEEMTAKKSKGILRLFQKNKPTTPNEEPQSLLTKTEGPRSEEELKRRFLDDLFPFQLKWASTTLRDKSFIDRVFYHDENLMRLLQRIPDTYFLMYKPIVELKKAILEAETMLIGPFGIEIIYELDLPRGTKIYPTNETIWYKEQAGVRSKLLSPMIALNRTETYVKSVLDTYQLDFPYQKVVLGPELSFQNTVVPYQTDYIGKEQYGDWLKDKRKLKSPLKHTQLKAAEVLLKHSQTTSVKRPEWDVKKELMEE